MSTSQSHWATAALAALLVAIVATVYFGTKLDLFRCDGGSAYWIANTINLGGCPARY